METFVIGLLRLSRYFNTVGNVTKANHVASQAERYEPEDPSPLLEGWINMSRGEIHCTEGQFSESIYFFDKATECFFEAGDYELWGTAIKQLATAQILMGNLDDTLSMLEKFSNAAKAVRAFGALGCIRTLMIFVAAERGDIKEAKKHSEMMLEDSRISDGRLLTVAGAAESAVGVYNCALAFLELSEGSELDLSMKQIDDVVDSLPR